MSQNPPENFGQPSSDPQGPTGSPASVPSASDPYGQPYSPPSVSDPYSGSATQPTVDPYAQPGAYSAPSASDPYSQPPAADEYAPPTADPYAAQPGAYSAPSASDPYAQPAVDPYAQPQVDPHAQQGYAQPQPDPYAQQGYAPHQGYGQPQADPYAQQPGYPPQQYPQPGYPQQMGAAPVGPPVSQADERLWATLAHAGIPIVGFLGPLVIYLIYKDRSAFLREAAAEALNFSIIVSAGLIVSSILMTVGIGFVTYGIIWVGAVVLAILAAIASNKGELYRYPINWRLVK